MTFLGRSRSPIQFADNSRKSDLVRSHYMPLVYNETSCRYVKNTRKRITGSAVAVHCCKAHERINRKTGNLTPCKIVTPENFSSKICTRDYVVDGNYCAIFCENRFSGGFSPNRWNITPLSVFFTVLSCHVLFSRSCAQVEPVDRFSRFMAQTTSFRASKCLLGVTTIDDVIWENMPPKPPKSGRE